jgi:hypothetical protein
MAALTGITGVRPFANTSIVPKAIYGETIGFGKAIYLDPATNLWMLADSNLSVLAAGAKGISMTPGVLNSYGIIATSGDIFLVGAAGVVSTTYFAGPTPGDLIPEADRTTGEWLTRMMTCIAASTFRINIEAVGVQKP